MLKIHLLIVSGILSGCVAYPAYYPTYPVGSNQDRAQALANEECAKSGKVAVQVEQTNCSGENCTRKFVCQ